MSSPETALKTPDKVICYHCGEDCLTRSIRSADKYFCCEGCKLVYQLLNQNGLCNYYLLNEQPGVNQRQAIRKDKFAFLDDIKIKQQLISFADADQTHVLFYIPQVHCSSCLYLLENLYKFEPGIISTRLHFERKEIMIIFKHEQVSLRKIAELLAGIGYEPYISLNNITGAKPRTDKRMVYQLGVAGFCFANIMLLSFPEYLGLAETDSVLQPVFRLLSLLLALPVFLYSAWPFYTSGWKALQHKFLNIDAPVAFAIIITFTRSVYEVVSGTGSGYFDSMSGIVFFMLIGRVLQDRTYRQLSFDRDFTAYFPIAVTVLKEEKELPTALPDIKPGDTLLIHHEELIPADGILTKGRAFIDYSFVTGESLPVTREAGEIVYAGGKQTGGVIELLVIKEVAQSYLTQLWAREEFTKGPAEKSVSFVHLVSRWFTWMVLLIAVTAALYWLFTDSRYIWNAVTAVLIVACPCALLLSHTFTNGNILRILSRNKLYLRSAQVIEDIANTNQIVFDKTGTLTTTKEQHVEYIGTYLSVKEQKAVAALAAQSSHPLSKAITQYYCMQVTPVVDHFREAPGQGVLGNVRGMHITLGSKQFVTGHESIAETDSNVFIAIDNKLRGHYKISNHYRDHIAGLLTALLPSCGLSVISGDLASEQQHLQLLSGGQATLLFRQSPEDKLQYIKKLQQKGAQVMMIGDGLNDAGALKQSNTGIAVAENGNNFTPASDAVIDAGQLIRLPQFIQLCKAGKCIIMISFILSIGYNIIGLSFAVRGSLSPLVAAILMPASSLSILLITYGCTNLAARWRKL